MSGHKGSVIGKHGKPLAVPLCTFESLRPSSQCAVTDIVTNREITRLENREGKNGQNPATHCFGHTGLLWVPGASCKQSLTLLNVPSIFVCMAWLDINSIPSPLRQSCLSTKSSRCHQYACDRQQEWQLGWVSQCAARSSTIHQYLRLFFL